MSNQAGAQRSSLGLAASLLLVGQVGYIAITQFHAGGHANDHHEIFETYAHDQVWSAVHLGQFGSMALLLGGLIVLASSLETGPKLAHWLTRFGTAAAVATLALYGVLQAVDGVALKQSVVAWTNAPASEQASRFAAAETIRWLEWGMRSYQDYAFGSTLVLIGAAVFVSKALPRLVGPLLILSGLSYLWQGWIAGSDGFSAAQSVAIVFGWLTSLVWMIWLGTVAWLRGRKAVFTSQTAFQH